MKFELPIKVVSEANQSSPGNWRAKVFRTKAQRGRIAFAMMPYKHKLPFPARVTFTRVGPRLLDSDNLQGAFKGIRDEVAKWIGQDDGNPMYEWVYKQTKGKPKVYGIVIEIEQV